MKILKLIVASAVIAAAGVASAQWTFTTSPNRINDGDWHLNVNVSGANLTITGIATAGTNGSLDLSAPVDGGNYTITAIGNSAFRNATFTDVILPANLASIGEHAFRDCTSLVNVTPFLPATVTLIGQRAFQDCTALEGALVLSNPNLKIIEMSTFHFTKITSVDLAGSAVHTLGESAFNGTKVTHVTLPKTLETMNNNVFRDCTSLTNVVPFMPPAVKTIRDRVFNNCPNLKIPLVLNNKNGDNITITQAAFNTMGITGIDFGEGVSSLTTSDLFANCLGVTQVVFRAGVPAFVSNSNTFGNWAVMQAVVLIPRGCEEWETFVANGGTYANQVQTSLTSGEITAFQANFPGAKLPDMKIHMPNNQGRHQALKWYKPAGPPETLLIIK